MTKKKLSVVVSTKNEEKNIKNLCESIINQTYGNYEMIVVDHPLTNDNTALIAKKYTKLVYIIGPERSTQRNFGISMATGDYILILDADMILDSNVFQELIDQIESNEKLSAVIIPEISIGHGFWAKCRALEKKLYVGNEYIEAARFFKYSVMQTLGGYDTNLISGEDWDLSQRAKSLGEVGRINAPIYHNDGEVNFWKSLKKKFYYGKFINKYANKDHNSKYSNKQMNAFYRYFVLFKRPKILFENPTIGVGLVILKSFEFLAVACGVLHQKLLSEYEKHSKR